MNKCKATVLLGLLFLGIILGSCEGKRGVAYGRAADGKFRRI
jgi:hypothetical protein